MKEVSDLPVQKGTVMEYRLETRIEQEGQKEIFVYEGQGQMVQMGEWLYLRYVEAETSNKVTIKVSRAGKMTIMRRQGDVLLSRLSFDSEKSGSAQIPTEAGLMEIETKTNQMVQNYKEQPFSGYVEVAYTIGIGEDSLGSYEMSLQFTT